jgi:hypothetical protein
MAQLCRNGPDIRGETTLIFLKFQQWFFLSIYLQTFGTIICNIFDRVPTKVMKIFVRAKNSNLRRGTGKPLSY